MPHDVFISYSKEDKPVADAACATLESRGIRCWIAPRDVLPGMDWGDTIVRAISKSRVMVLVFSSNANRSQQIKREVNQAIEREVTIIPFRIENVLPSGSMEYYLDVTHWLDALTPPMEQHFQELASTVKLLLEGGTPSTSVSWARVSGESRQSPKPRPNRLLLLGGIIVMLALASLIVVLASRYWRRAPKNNPNQTATLSPTPTVTPGVEITSSPTPKPSRSPTAPKATPTPRPKPAYGPDTCIQGYVWREASPSDHVCVTPETRAETLADNQQADARREPKGGPHGPNTCIQGYVWREAFPDDVVCVPPATREKAAEDNRQAKARVVQ